MNNLVYELWGTSKDVYNRDGLGDYNLLVTFSGCQDFLVDVEPDDYYHITCAIINFCESIKWDACKEYRLHVRGMSYDDDWYCGTLFMVADLNPDLQPLIY